MPSLTREGGAGGGLLRAVSLTRSLRLMLWRVLPSVAARPPPEEPAEEPAERLQPDGAAGGQRLAAPDRGLHAQPHPDHGRGQCPHACRLQLSGVAETFPGFSLWCWGGGPQHAAAFQITPFISLLCFKASAKKQTKN